MEHLVRRMPTVVVHESSRPAVQMSSMIQPLGSVANLTWKRPWHERNVSSRELFAVGQDTHRSSWPYFFSPVDALPAELRAELGGLLARLRTPFLPALESNAWAAAPGVTSPLHYDAAHNVYSQLTGRKRWLLLSPDDAPRLYPYPRLHPSTRQSQIDLHAPPERGFDHYRGARGRLRVLEVVLAPGDRLYVPPYWWHHVRVVGGASAVAVATYTQSTPMRAYNVVKAHALPEAIARGCHADGGARAADGLASAHRRASCLSALRAYILALAALAPPGFGMSSVVDCSFACIVSRRCVCFIEADAYERRDGVLATESVRSVDDVWSVDVGGSMAAEPGMVAVRELLETRYRHLDEPSVVEGIPQMMASARARLRAQLADGMAHLPPSAVRRVRAHARALRLHVAALPVKGDGVVTPAIWRTEMLSLIEDVASAAVGASEVEAVLAWIAGHAV